MSEISKNSTLIQLGTKIVDGSNTYNWPVKINSNVNIVLSGKWDLEDNSHYFIINGDNINIEGSEDIDITVSVDDYPGLVQNGFKNTDGFNNICIQNLIIRGNNCSLLRTSGWIAQRFFGKNATQNSVKNCKNYSNISTEGGGICGYNSGENGSLSIVDCQNYGEITRNGGGIIGRLAGINNGQINIENCKNCGEIVGNDAGGIVGEAAGQNNGKIIINNCINTGNIISNTAGGIAGRYCATENGQINISKSYNTGNVFGNESGGILGALAGQNNGVVTLTNCYSLCDVNGRYNGGIFGRFAGRDNGKITISNVYYYGVLNESTKEMVPASSSLGYLDGTVAVKKISNSYFPKYPLYAGKSIPDFTSVFANTSGLIVNGVQDIESSWNDLYAQILLYNLGENVWKSNNNNPYTFLNEDSLSDTSSELSYGDTYPINMPAEPINNAISINNVISVSQIEEVCPVAPICFPAGTPVNTDQGIVAINKIDKNYHTINNKSIFEITETVSPDEFLIVIDKDSLGLNLPNKKTIISSRHRLSIRGRMVSAFECLKISNRVEKKKYEGELLYNILMDNDEECFAKVNNLTVETLNPTNIVAKLYKKIANLDNKNNYIHSYNSFIRKNLGKSNSVIISLLNNVSYLQFYPPLFELFITNNSVETLPNNNIKVQLPLQIPKAQINTNIVNKKEQIDKMLQCVMKQLVNSDLVLNYTYINNEDVYDKYSYSKNNIINESKMKVKDLKNILRENDISGYNKMKKAECLEKLLQL